MEISLSISHLLLSSFSSICLMFSSVTASTGWSSGGSSFYPDSPKVKLFSPFLHCEIRRRSLTINTIQALFYSSWRKTLFVEGFYYHAVLDFRHCSSSTPCPTGTSASSILEHVAVCSWYINLTIDGAVYVSQHFPFGAAFVCQAGNFWTLLLMCNMYITVWLWVRARREWGQYEDCVDVCFFAPQLSLCSTQMKLQS